MKLLMPALP